MTGWHHDLLQDICRDLSRWFESRPGALHQLKEHMTTTTTLKLTKPQWQRVSTLVRQAAAEADFLAGDTTPAQQAKYEREFEELQELLREVEEQATVT